MWQITLKKLRTGKVLQYNVIDNYIVRIASNSDLDAILSVSIESFSYEIGILGEAPPGFNDYSYFCHVLRDETKQCFVLEEKSTQRIVGIAISKLTFPGVYLSRFCILPEFQNKKLGQYFLKCVEFYYPGLSWELHVACKLQNVVKFYEILNYKIRFTEIIGNVCFYVMQKIVSQTKSHLFLQLTGAQSTGKTTLVTSLVKELSLPAWVDIIPISEISRSLLKAGSITKLDVQASDYEQMILNAELLLKHKQVISSLKNVAILIADRSPICCLSYARNIQNPSAYMLKFTENLVKQYVDIPTIYLSPVIEFVADNVRCKESQEVIDNEVQNILKEFNIPAIRISETSLEDRVRVIKAYIYNYFFN